MKPEALEESGFRAPAGVPEAQQIAHDLCLRDNRTIQMKQPWHASSLKVWALCQIPSVTTREAQFGCGSNQPHALQARMPVPADDDVVVHGNAERGGDIDDRLRHLDVPCDGVESPEG